MLKIENISASIEWPEYEPGTPAPHPSMRNPNAVLPEGVWNVVVAGDFNGATCRLECRTAGGLSPRWMQVGEPFTENLVTELNQPGASYRYRLRIEPGPKAAPSLMLAVE